MADEKPSADAMLALFIQEGEIWPEDIEDIVMGEPHETIPPGDF